MNGDLTGNLLGLGVWFVSFVALSRGAYRRALKMPTAVPAAAAAKLLHLGVGATVLMSVGDLFAHVDLATADTDVLALVLCVPLLANSHTVLTAAGLRDRLRRRAMHPARTHEHL